ncbi:MAG: DUF4332 domain-containing protein [Hyphomicrobiaceae bacterium]
MTLLFRVLHAAHARGTHHKLVLDGVSRLGGAEAEAWQRVFLKHADVLLLGAKAPDDEFRDFTNHVLHPRDNWWGGAPVKARSWYGHLVAALAEGNWSLATYCAGVLSHYLTDPLQPFHTGQTEAENNIHRAFEWSVANSYGALMSLAGKEARRQLVVPNTANWIEALVAEGAREANTQYEKLIAHFDIHRAVIDPASGLDVVAKRIIAAQLERAIATVATVIDLAIEEAKVKPPVVTLGLDTIVAMIKIPAKRWTKRIENTEERRLVERIYDELKATGTVEKNLPEDERVVRAAFAAEVLAKRKTSDGSKQFPYKPQMSVETTVDRRERLREEASKPIPANATPTAKPPTDWTAPEQLSVEPPRPAPLAADRAAPAEPIVRRTSLAQSPPAEAAPVAAHQAEPVLTPTLVPKPAMRVVARATPAAEPTTGGPRLYLTGQHAIVDAPSIGPKMAEKLEPLGLKTVDDLFAAVPEALALALGNSAVDAETVRDWQDQARLVCTVPGVRGTHAQLLVGAGFRNRAQLAEAEVDTFCARVLAFAVSPHGQRVLRNGDPPDMERIRSWVENAKAALAA